MREDVSPPKEHRRRAWICRLTPLVHPCQADMSCHGLSDGRALRKPPIRCACSPSIMRLSVPHAACHRMLQVLMVAGLYKPAAGSADHAKLTRLTAGKQ